MFGHDDQSQQHQDANPTPGGALTTDDGQVLSAPPTPANDTAGDYLDDEQPTAPPTTPEHNNPTPTNDTPVGGHPNADQLLDIKQQALQQLSPLIDHLDQNPEEKFRTTMMMIQASDNDALIKAAYDAALQIQDEKVRAQALLDIVNEINYFTHTNNSADAEA